MMMMVVVGQGLRSSRITVTRHLIMQDGIGHCPAKTAVPKSREMATVNSGHLAPAHGMHQQRPRHQHQPLVRRAERWLSAACDHCLSHSRQHALHRHHLTHPASQQHVRSARTSLVGLKEAQAEAQAQAETLEPTQPRASAAAAAAAAAAKWWMPELEVSETARKGAAVRIRGRFVPSRPKASSALEARVPAPVPLVVHANGPQRWQTRHLHVGIPRCNSTDNNSRGEDAQGANAGADVRAGGGAHQKQERLVEEKEEEAGPRIAEGTVGSTADEADTPSPAGHVAVSSDPDAIRLRAEAVLAERTHLSPGQLRHLFIQMEALPHHRLMLRIVTQQMQQGKEVCAKLWQSILVSMGNFASSQDLEQVLRLTHDLHVWPGSTPPPPTVLLARVQSYFNAGDQAEAMRVLREHVECNHLFQTRFRYVDLLRGRVRKDDFSAIRAITNAYPQHVSLMSLASLGRLALDRKNEPLAARTLMLWQSDLHPAAISPEPQYPIKNLCRLVLWGLVARSNKNVAVQFYRWCADTKVRIAPALVRSLMTMVADFGDVPRACHVLASAFIVDRKIPGDLIDLLVRAYANAHAGASSSSSDVSDAGTRSNEEQGRGNGSASTVAGHGDDNGSGDGVDGGKQEVYEQHASASGAAGAAGPEGVRRGEGVRAADLQQGETTSVKGALEAQDEAVLVREYLMAGEEGLRKRDARKIAADFQQKWARHQKKATRKEQQMGGKWTAGRSVAAAAML